MSPMTTLCAFAAALLCACDGAETPGCRAADECANGQECVDGGCIGADGEGEGEEGEGEEGEGEEGEGEEGEGEGDAGEGEGEGDPEGCRDDGDEALSSRELPLAFDIPLRNIEATASEEDLPVDVVGVVVDGVRTWDFSGALPGDAPVQVQAELLEGHWFDDDVDLPTLADGDVVYASLLDATTWGIFHRTADELLIIAVASDDEEVDTLIQYDPPIKALVYPLVDGDSFSSESQGSGTFQGNAFYSSTDTYESTVTGRGVVKTPAGDFPVWRVQTRQQVDINFTIFSVERRTVIFVTPCTGVVASVTSAEDAPDFAFTEAQRVRRVGLPE